MPSHFAAVVTDPDLATILAQVEFVFGTYCTALRPGVYLIGCRSMEHAPGELNAECTQAIRDAERVRELLIDVELVW